MRAANPLRATVLSTVIANAVIANVVIANVVIANVVIATAAIAAAVLAPFGAAAHAQDAPKAPVRAEEAAPPAETMSLRALDLSAMMEASQAGGQEPAEVALASRSVKALWRGPHGPESLDLTTDADGRFLLPMARIAPGTRIEFLVPDTTGDSRWPLFAAPPLTAGEPVPRALVFLRVEGGENPLSWTMHYVTATVPDRAEGLPSLRVQIIGGIVNEGNRLWLGPKGDLGHGTLRVRIPQGFTLVNAKMGGADVPAELAPRPDGASDAVLRQPVWPSLFSDDGRPLIVQLSLAAQYSDSAAYDLSFVTDLPIEDLRLNLESGVLVYDGGEGDVQLEDAGPNPTPEGKAPTNGWTAQHVHRGQGVALRFRPASGAFDYLRGIHPRVWITLGTLALVIAGAFFLAKAMARRTGGRPAEPSRPAPDADEREAKLRELDRRLAKGEITSFEHAARKSQIEGVPRRTSPAATSAATSATTSARSGVGGTLDEISARVDTADADTLRRDVRSLLAMLRGRGK